MIMKLEDLIPEKPTFTLAATGKSYELRIPNYEDKLTFVRMCGGEDQIKLVFQERRWSDICKIVYRLMVDKSDFPATRDKQLDDDGIEQDVLVTGPIMLLRAIRTQSEAIGMLGAFNAASVASEPLIGEFVAGELKKNSLALQTGERSSTSSPVSTATPQPSSESSPSASST